MSRVDASPLVIKKYGNRRLYDTAQSRYVTLEELAETVRSGVDVRVVDAKTGADLTATTLTQVIIEGRGAANLLPVPLLLQLVRLRDDALAEFFGRWVTLALEAYLQTKQGIESVAPFHPFAGYPLAASNAFGRLFGGMSPWSGPTQPPATPAQPPQTPVRSRAVERDDVADLRREIEELRKAVRGATPKPRGARGARTSSPSKRRGRGDAT